MVKQQERIVHLEKENMELKEQIQNLNAQLNQQHEQSQYHKHENEQDFGMYHKQRFRNKEVSPCTTH